MRRLVLTLLLILLPLIVRAASPVFLTGLLIQPGATSTQITFILTQKTFGRVKYIPHPDRVIIEFEHTNKHFTISNAKLGGSNIKSMSAAELKNEVLQFTFFVTGNVHTTTQFLPEDSDAGTRLKLTIISAKPIKKALSPPEKKKKLVPPLSVKREKESKKMPVLAVKEAPSLEKNVPVEVKKPRIFTVVIDAGHGGKDPGARAANGTEEKDVVLAIAKKLAHEINQQPHLRAVMTRNGDYFVPLGQRLKLARKGDADLFVAIHADAYFNNSASGASVYVLSPHGASTVAARWLAQRENHEDLDGVELDSLKDQSSMLRSVMIDLAQTVTKQDSLRLGMSVLDTLERLSPLHYTHVERAPFLVLKSPDIPSILVETGFLSNPREAHRLADPAYQSKIAQALCLGVADYVKKYGVMR